MTLATRLSSLAILTLFCSLLPSVLAASSLDQLQKLDRDLALTTTRLVDGTISSCEEARAAASTLTGRLRDLQRETAREQARPVGVMQAKLDALQPLVGNLRRAAEAFCGNQTLDTQALPNVSSPGKALTALAGSDACQDAPLIDFGNYVGSLVGATQDGSASCAAGGVDVWYKISAADYVGTVGLDTIGSDFDTVLSVHSSCPGTPTNQTGCSDDNSGLQSALTLTLNTATYWIRVSGFDGETGDYQLNYGDDGTVEGTVSDAQTDQPLEDVSLFLYEDGYFQSSALTAADGTYTLPGRTNAQIRTSNALGYAEELYQDLPCFNTCDVSRGTVIPVAANSTQAGIDFQLSMGATIEGTVRDLEGSALAGVGVRLWDSTGGFVGIVSTTATGSYSFSRLPPGTYYVSARSSLYVGQLYNAVACAGGPPDGCSVTDGTGVTVASAETVANIDFQLTALGSISGTVLSLTGSPLANADVSVYTHPGLAEVASASSDAQGQFNVGGLVAGSYVVVVQRYDYLAQVFDGIDCTGFLTSSCDFDQANLVSAAIDTETTGIDFQLRNRGRVSGTVRDTVGNPLADVWVRVREPHSYFPVEAQALTDADGHYEVMNVLSGNYIVHAGGDAYRNQLYPGLTCPGSFFETCATQDAALVRVFSGSHLTDIDFSLPPAGRVYGEVTDEMGNDVSMRIEALAVDDGSLLGVEYTEFGAYAFGGLPLEAIHLRTRSCVTPDCRPYLRDEYYENAACTGLDTCPTAGATEILPQAGVQLGSFDFVLERLGTLSGRILQAGTGDIVEAEAQLWDAAGNLLDRQQSNFEGRFTFRVWTGAYTVTASAPDHAAQLHQDMPCSFAAGIPTCDVTTGDAISVQLGEDVANIDFDLVASGVLSGRALTPHRVPISGVRVEVWTVEGQRVDSENTDSQGRFHFYGLDGTYVLSVNPNSQNYHPTLHEGLLCPDGIGTNSGTCAPAKGTPVLVAPDNSTPEVEIRVFPETSAFYGSVRASSGTPLPYARIDAWSTADGTFVTSSTADSEGRYFLTLPVGSYHLSSRVGGSYIDQVYPDIECPDGSAFDGLCAPSAGAFLQTLDTLPLRADFVLGLTSEIRSDDFESGTLTGWTVVP